MVGPPDAIGMIEVQGLARGFLAANIAVRAAAVAVDGVGFIQGGGVMVAIRGDVASVGAATAAARAAVPDATVHAVGVLGRPDGQIRGLLAERQMIRPGARAFGAAGGVGRSRTGSPRGRSDDDVGGPGHRRRAGAEADTGSDVYEDDGTPSDAREDHDG